MSMGVGAEAPDFTMQASGGRSVSLASLRGRPVVLYFYPKADTSGCTKEACGFEEKLPELAGLGLEVIGVSKDPMKALDRFAEKYKLTFPLASDQEGVAEAYGVWVEKQMYGRKYMGMERTTFLIDAKGKIAQVWPKVSVTDHAADVLNAAKKLK